MACAKRICTFSFYWTALLIGGCNSNEFSSVSNGSAPGNQQLAKVSPEPSEQENFQSNSSETSRDSTETRQLSANARRSTASAANVTCKISEESVYIVMDVLRGNSLQYSVRFGAGGSIAGLTQKGRSLITKVYKPENQDVDHVHQVTWWTAAGQPTSKGVPIHPGVGVPYPWNINQAGRNDNRAAQSGVVQLFGDDCQLSFFTKNPFQYKDRNIARGVRSTMNRWYKGTLFQKTTYSLYSDGALKVDIAVAPQGARYINRAGRWSPYRKFRFIQWLPFLTQPLGVPCLLGSPSDCLRTDNSVYPLRDSGLEIGKRNQPGRLFSLFYPTQASNGIKAVRVKRKNSTDHARNANMVITVGYNDIVQRPGDVFHFSYAYLPQVGSATGYKEAQRKWAQFYANNYQVRVNQDRELWNSLVRRQYFETSARQPGDVVPEYIQRGFSKFRACPGSNCSIRESIPAPQSRRRTVN